MNQQEQIQNKIREIAEQTDANTQDFGLLSGKMGITLWYFYLSRYVDESYYEIAEKSLLEILDNLKNTDVVFSHCRGYSGVCWALMHLKEYDFIDLDVEILDNMDDYLLVGLAQALKEQNWDFLHGASGIILYFLKRQQQSSNNEYLDKYLAPFVELMNDMAIPEKDDSMKWESILYKTDKETKTGYNICLSHGASSLVVVFTKIFLLYNKSNDSLRNMIEKTVQYIINQRIDEKTYGSCFPSYSIESSQPLSISRMAWCYGDLGIAMALWQAGVTLDKQEWRQIAVETMKHAATRKIDYSTADAGVCHGTAGIAHIFNRMFQYTQIEEFKTASDYWIDETLKMAKFDDGIAGYKTYYANKQEKYFNNYNLLEGVSGIGLCLLSALYEDASAWDECLLLS